MQSQKSQFHPLKILSQGESPGLLNSIMPNFRQKARDFNELFLEEFWLRKKLGMMLL